MGKPGSHAWSWNIIEFVCFVARIFSFLKNMVSDSTLESRNIQSVQPSKINLRTSRYGYFRWRTRLFYSTSGKNICMDNSWNCLPACYFRAKSKNWAIVWSKSSDISVCTPVFQVQVNLAIVWDYLTKVRLRCGIRVELKSYASRLPVSDDHNERDTWYSVSRLYGKMQHT